MSHIVLQQSEVKMTNVNHLKLAAQQLGLVFHEGAKQAAYWNGQVTPCDHMIELPEYQFQIAVKNKEGDLQLSCDSDARDLFQTAGKGLSKLFLQYRSEERKEIAGFMSHRVHSEEFDAAGQLVLTVEVP